MLIHNIKSHLCYTIIALLINFSFICKTHKFIELIN